MSEKSIPEKLTTDTFKKKIFDYESNKEWKFNGGRPAIIDFYADWCGPCRMLAPILDEVSVEYAGKVDVFKIDTEAQPELAQLFGIRSIPSVLFVPMTGEPAMNAGFIPREGFDRAISELFGVK
jgi:thioredoxin 1